MYRFSLWLPFCISCLVAYGLTQSATRGSAIENTPVAISSPIGMPKDPCNGCNVVADYSFETSSVASRSDFTFGPSGIINLSKTVYIVFSAYSITSTFFDGTGPCTTFSGTPITHSPALSLVSPVNVATSIVLLEAQSSFMDVLQLRCSADQIIKIPATVTPGASRLATASAMSIFTIVTATPTRELNISAFATTASPTTTPIDVTLTTSTYSSPLSSSNTPPPSATSAPPSTGLSIGANVGMGVGALFTALFLSIIGVLVHRCVKKRPTTLKEPHAELESRQRAELAATQRRLEMEAGDRRHELTVEEPRHELSGSRKSLRSSMLRISQFISPGPGGG